MPRPRNRNLQQKAVLWAYVDRDNYGHIRVSSTSVEISVGWDQSLTEQIGPEGDPVAVTGTVYVDQDIDEGSILWLGKLKDLPSPVTSGLMEVVTFNKTPDIKGRKFTRSCSIRRYKDSLPTQV